MTSMSRVDIIPSTSWTAIPMAPTDSRMVWAEDIGDGKVATYWVKSPEPSTGNVWLIRQGELLSLPGGGIPTVPPNYLPADSGMEGSVLFLNGEFFFWMAQVTLTYQTDPLVILEGDDLAAVPTITYPRNAIYGS
jgi:hypothetical protein